MNKQKTKKKFGFWIVAATFLAVAISTLFPVGVKKTAKNDVVAHAYSEYAFTVQSYHVQATVKKNRQVDFVETIALTVNTNEGTMFFRSLPIDGGDRYFNISASCADISGFRYKVEDNPDTDGFLDICCIGGIYSGAQHTYTLKYTMLPSDKTKDGLCLDVIGTGWAVPLKNVSVDVKLPFALNRFKVMSGVYGQKDQGYASTTVSADNKSLHITAPSLPVGYVSKYNEHMAAGITLDFHMEKDLKGYYVSTLTGSVPLTIGVCLLLCAIGAIVAVKNGTPREVVRVVNIKAPKEMDPLKMGKLIDGKVDSEDITSMIYYFASQGYLTIDMANPKNPVLHRTEKEMPSDLPGYQKVLLEGLFARGQTETKISQLSLRFAMPAEHARSMISAKDKPHFEQKSTGAFLLCAVLATLIFMFPPLLFGLIFVGGKYAYFGGLTGFMASAIFVVLAELIINRKYKDGKKAKFLWKLLTALVVAIYSAVYIFVIGKHLCSFTERVIACVFAFLTLIIGAKCKTYTEEYANVLGDILGFKDFIEFTEKDRLEAMLDEMPELYYDVLPYAQVLGVSKVWEDKFKTIRITRPGWLLSDDAVFDYMVINHSLRLATSSLANQIRQAGSTVGRSGGGGFGGGFSGGGHGGGGGGIR